MQTEIYLLCHERSQDLAVAILDAVAIDRKPAADDYPVPQYEDSPRETYASDLELLRYLEATPSEPYSLYCDNARSAEPGGCMLFFTRDAAMIFGVAVLDADAGHCMEKLANICEARFGYSSFEAAPPGTVGEFIARCRSGPSPRLVEGRIF